MLQFISLESHNISVVKVFISIKSNDLLVIMLIQIWDHIVFYVKISFWLNNFIDYIMYKTMDKKLIFIRKVFKRLKYFQWIHLFIMFNQCWEKSKFFEVSCDLISLIIFNYVNLVANIRILSKSVVEYAILLKSHNNQFMSIRSVDKLIISFKWAFKCLISIESVPKPNISLKSINLLLVMLYQC